ncbi:hypothetical protein K2173_028332 [Erythroxylum novogranatense]|uniref:COBRA-like protein n=1 Tax=Erythroxylum novogranatense TaxID=1862640 RepID=A0AAV8U1P8_9ROSI|nr:hypothetical protein K2173_028332 [Erythroxylum novogranatense]
MHAPLLECLLNVAVLLVTAILRAAAYDTLDPQGSINIQWDVTSWTPDGYVAVVSIYNYQMFRQIINPRWTLGWTWAKNEVIWSMVGAQAIDQGDCSQLKENIPHCCARDPSVVDLLPGVPMQQQYTDCCKSGVLTSWGQDPKSAVSKFQISVGQSGTSNTTIKLPNNFYMLGPGPGYTCSAATIVSPSVFFSVDGRRKTRAMMTWSLTCSYSQTIASKNPTCCVSLSAFYNPVVTACPSCSCGCQNNCFMSDPKISSVVEADKPTLQCTQHMCPVRVHWHIKANYKEYWRVKITITNFKYRMNYTHWTLVAQHPNLNNITEVYRFNYKPILLYNPLNETGMFYGIKYYNDLLLEAGPSGNVQSEMILMKDRNKFSFGQGWAFPRKIYFNGDECMMPLPDSYPTLPNFADSTTVTSPMLVAFLTLVGCWCSLSHYY